MKTLKSGLLIAWLFTLGCEHASRSNAELIADGWAALESHQYGDAESFFSQARHSGQAEAYTGRGWSFLLSGQIDDAANAFNGGSTKEDITADLYAGWAFALNAKKYYTHSNDYADSAFSLAMTWKFSHAPEFDYKDLRIVKAENYFSLGEFDQSLSEVQKVVYYSADVSTNAGRASLAQTIEFLKNYYSN